MRETEPGYRKWLEEWTPKIPTIQFPSDWNIKIVPNFGGSLVRFRVISGKRDISVYLDVDSSLGYYLDGPYWEVYPSGDDVSRVAMANVKGLIDVIQGELRK